MDKVMCAWCGETLRTNSPVEHSHGICEECKKRILKEYKNEKRDQGGFETATGNSR
jgi:hypothetical protein